MTTTAEFENITTQRTAEPHAHHWRIAEPNGAESVGHCRTCGETKLFRNSLVEEPMSFGAGPLLAA